MSKQPEALKLAEQLEDPTNPKLHLAPYIAAELRKLTQKNQILLEALKAIVQSLAEHDDEGMIEHAEQMINARSAITYAEETVMTESINYKRLSERVRPGVEAAPWVFGSIVNLEEDYERLRKKVQELEDRCDDLAADKGTYFRLYEALCIKAELDKKANKNVVADAINWLDGVPTTEDGMLILTKSFVMSNIFEKLSEQFGLERNLIP